MAAFTYDAINAEGLQLKGEIHAANMVSADRHATIIPVTFASKMEDADKHFDAYLAAVKQHATGDVQVLTVGDLSVDDAFNTTA